MPEGRLRTVGIDVETLTEEAFRPFGELLAPADRPPDFTGINSVGWRARFESDSPAEVMFYRSSPASLRFSMLERHHHVTQSFIPLGHVSSIIAVAAPTGPDEAPEPEAVRAFLLDGSAGYVLNAGIWHALDRYPLGQEPADVVIITDRATQHELETNRPGPWGRTEAVDYAERFGVSFEIKL